jgi:hypothetical protein
VNAGEFGIGWDNPDWGEYGLNWGTCLFEVGDGKATALKKITDGLITVTSREEKVDDKDVVIWTIFWGVDYPTEILFEGAIPALTKPKKPVGPVVPDYLFTEEITAGDVEKHAITITDKDENVLAYVELLMAPAETNYEGSYPSTSYASQPGQMCDGYNFPDWGISGGSWYMDGEEKKYIGAGAATLVVTKIAEGAYDFTCEFFSYSCAGPDYVPGGEDVDALPATEVITEQGAGVDKHTITLTDNGETVAVFELLVATGGSIEGTYVSTEYASEAGMICNGYSFPDWGIYGGSYYMKDGVRADVAPGEVVEVTKVSDNVYKFEGDAGFTFYADLS